MKKLLFLLLFCIISIISDSKDYAIEDTFCNLDSEILIQIDEDIDNFLFHFTLGVKIDFSPNDDETTHRRNNLDTAYLSPFNTVPCCFIKQSFIHGINLSFDLFRYYICTNAP